MKPWSCEAGGWVGVGGGWCQPAGVRRELAVPIFHALGGAAADQETRTDACEQAHEPRHQTKGGDDEVEEGAAGPAGAREHYGSTEREQMRNNARRHAAWARHGQGTPGGPPPIVLECGVAREVCGCRGAHNEAGDGDALGLVGLRGQVRAVGAHETKKALWPL